MGTTHQGAPGPPGAPWWVVPPSEHHPQVLLWPTVCLLVQKIHKKFHAVWTPSNIDFCDLKNKQKTATGTGHWVNRLVPKNDIKLL